MHYSEDMDERIAPEPAPVARIRSQRFRAAAVIVLAVVIGLVLWLALREGGGSSTNSSVTAVSVSQLTNLAASVNHPIFWLGPRAGYTYELTRLQNGTINIRYLPSGVDVGSSKPYLSVATYPFPNAYAALKNIKAKNVVFLKIPKNGIAEYTKAYPQSVHAAYPGVDYQVEVYDPTPGTAAGLLVSGELSALGDLKAGSAAAEAPKPTAASAAELASLARSVGHPIYWVGAKKRYTYEVRRTTSGKVTIRYLPPGVDVGAAKPYLTVGTYPFPRALATIKALAKQKDIEQIKLPGGGLAVVSKGYPQSIHLAYPRSKLQIEVYDPSATRVRAIVSSGQVRAIG
jgi:hypothetical protein